MRFFTPDEANEALVRVRPIVEALVERRRDFREAEMRLAEIRRAVLGNGSGIDPSEETALRSELAAAAEAMDELVEEVHAAGAQVKDPDVGLVDFPARHPDGAVVLLCWRLGEDEIAYWHDLESGFAGRKPLPF
jgi:hypothetical protein